MNHMLRAVEIYNVIQAERDWLTVAGRWYSNDTYQRLMQYSADRLQRVFRDQFDLGIHDVQICADVVGPHEVQVQVLVAWKGDIGKAMQRAHLQLCNPIAHA